MAIVPGMCSDEPDHGFKAYSLTSCERVPTQAEFVEAQRLLKFFQECDLCHRLFAKAQMQDTWFLGQHKWWCKTCYPKVKYD